MTRQVTAILLTLLLHTQAWALVENTDASTFGRASTTAAKQLIFNTGDGAGNKRFSMDAVTNLMTWNSDLTVTGDLEADDFHLLDDADIDGDLNVDGVLGVTGNSSLKGNSIFFGDNANSDKTFFGNRSGVTDPYLQWDEAKLAWVFSNDGVNEFEMGSGSGGGDARNYVENFNFEIDASGVTAYADAAGVAPVDASGGAPTLTCTRNTSAPIYDTADLIITKDAANRQGEGCAIDLIQFQPGDSLGNVMTVRFILKSSTAFALGDIRAYLINEDTGEVIEPVPTQVTAGINAHQKPIEFQTSPTGNDYKLAFHVASTSALAYTYQIDEVKVSKASTTSGAIQTATLALPGVTTNWTNTAVTAFYTRHGDLADVDILLTNTGTPAGSSLQVTLPFSVDTSKISYTGPNASNFRGFAASRDEGSSNTNVGAVSFNSGGSFDILYNNGTSTSAPITPTAPYSFDATDKISIRLYNIPISGWSPTTAMASEAGFGQVGARWTLSANQSIGTASAVFVSLDSATVESAFVQGMECDPVLYRCTATESGIYNVGGSVTVFNVTPGEVVDAYVYKNGVIISQGEITIPGSGLGFVGIPSTSIPMKKGDYLEVAIDSTVDASYLVVSGVGTYLTAIKTADHQALAASRVVSASYGTASGQVIPTSTLTVIDFESKIYDDHGAVTTGSGWVFTAPMAGKYSMSCMMTITQSSDFAAGEGIQAYIRKNGSNVAQNVFIFTSTGINSREQSVPIFTEESLVTGDTLQLVGFQDSGVNQNISLPAANRCSIHRIGGID